MKKARIRCGADPGLLSHYSVTQPVNGLPGQA
jgi:hypothetical protein